MGKRQADPYGRGGYCIVVALHGDESREAQILRDFRDKYLSNLPFGKRLISTYYSISPRMVSLVSGNRMLEVLTARTLSYLSSFVSGIVR